MTKTKRQKLAPLPRVTSKTITVGALLGKIKRLILEEPKRLDMADWVKMFKGEKVFDRVVVAQQPACGTVACMAGWGATLLRPGRVVASDLQINAEDAMTDALGFDYDGFGGSFRTVDGLFSDYAKSVFGEFGVFPPAGTVEQATMIAKRIDTYLSMYPKVARRKIVVATVQKALRA